MSPARPLGRDPGHQAGTPQGPQPPTTLPVPHPRVRNEYTNQHRGTWPDRRAHDWQAEHRNWQERGGYEGYRIPFTRYRSSFGPRHGFRMFASPLMMVGGFPRFQVGGLWFSILDPWPEYWSDDWYGSDDLYIELFGGGYYLCNRRYPMDRIAVGVYL